MLGALTTLVLVVVAVWETLSLRGLAGPEPAVEIPPSGDKASDKMRGAVERRRSMHTLMVVAGGLVALGIFVLASVLLGKGAAAGARVFIWPWLAAARDQHAGRGLLGQVSFSAELPVLAIVFGVPAAIAWYVAYKF